MARCAKLQLPVSSSRVRHNGERMPAAVLAPASMWFIVIMLKPAIYTFKKMYISCIYGDWWFYINDFESDKLPLLYQLATQFYVLSDPSRRDV